MRIKTMKKKQKSMNRLKAYSLWIWPIFYWPYRLPVTYGSCSCFCMTASWKQGSSVSSRTLPESGIPSMPENGKRKRNGHPHKRWILSARATSKWQWPGQWLPYRRHKLPLRRKALSCLRKTLLLTTETARRSHIRHKFRKRSSTRYSRIFLRRKWNTERTNRKKRHRTGGKRQDSALMKSVMRSA